MRFLLLALFFFLAPLPAFAVNSPGPPGSDGSDSGPDIFGTVDSFGFVNDDGDGDTPIPWVWDFLVFGNVAWLPTPNAFGYGANDFFFPLTLGFDL